MNNVDNYFEYINKALGESSDIVNRKIKINNTFIGYVYLESVSSDDKVSDFLMKGLNYIKKTNIDNLTIALQNSIPNSHLNIKEDKKEIFFYLASGFTCIFIDNEKSYIVVETKTKLDRGIVESTSEAIIRGPKDSFTENHNINIGLIRKRIKDKNLWVEDKIIGRRTRTKISIVYIKDIADKSLIKNIKEKLNNIDIDGILDSGYIREFLLDGKKGALPQFLSTERPDLVSSSLLQGKITILVENSPYALIIPALLVDFLHAPEDDYQKPINVTFVRALRSLAFILTILLPGLYVALTTFNQEIIPNELLISLAVQREGVPFPTAVETLMMILTFEILRESDIRIPNASASSIGIVGALVLGEAAVTAGVVSPIVIIIIGVTSIGGLLFTDIDIVNGIRWWRIIFLLFSASMGLIGFVVALLIFIIKLSSMEYNGVSYLSPFSPLNAEGFKDAILRFPRNKLFKRPSYLTKNTIKLRSEDEK